MCLLFSVSKPRCTPRPARFRCFPAPTHRIQISSSLSGAKASWWAGKHLQHAGNIWLGIRDSLNITQMLNSRLQPPRLHGFTLWFAIARAVCKSSYQTMSEIQLSKQNSEDFCILHLDKIEMSVIYFLQRLIILYVTNWFSKIGQLYFPFTGS